MAEKSRPLIKICGITRESDARVALERGADAIGMVFFEGSPRHVSAEQAAVIARSIGNKALKVGLFVNAGKNAVRDVLGKVPLDILQFHGDEDDAWCRQFRRPYWKAVRVKDDTDLPRELDRFPGADGILLDAWHADQYGGTGRTFDWSVLNGLVGDRHLILAGGLNPANVAQAVTLVRPWGVDVSSGVETAPGIKSQALIKQFIDEVRRV